MKKRVAFDVMGTLTGNKGSLIEHIFRALQAEGVECVVWSNSFGYAIDAIASLNLENTHPMRKMSRFELQEHNLEMFDLAIEDDRSQTWLGAKDFAFVDEITMGLVFKKLGLK